MFFLKVMPTSGEEFLSERFLFETRIVGFRDTLSRSKARRYDYDFISETYETMEVYTAGFIILFSG